MTFDVTLIVEEPPQAQIQVSPPPSVSVVTLAQQGPSGAPGPQGPPGPEGPQGPSGANYLHTQSTASSTWVVNHNLGIFPRVTVLDDGGNEVLAGVTHTSENQVVIQFGAPFSGRATFN